MRMHKEIAWLLPRPCATPRLPGLWVTETRWPRRSAREISHGLCEVYDPRAIFPSGQTWSAGEPRNLGEASCHPGFGASDKTEVPRRHGSPSRRPVSAPREHRERPMYIATRAWLEYEGPTNIDIIALRGCLLPALQGVRPLNFPRPGGGRGFAERGGFPRRTAIRPMRCI